VPSGSAVRGQSFRARRAGRIRAAVAPAAAFAEEHYHRQINPISRSRGHSIVAKAAYRGGMELVEEAAGKRHDYSDRTDVAARFIIAPENAPAWAHANDLSRFANEIDRAADRASARMATEFELALPHELHPGRFRSRAVCRHRRAISSPLPQGNDCMRKPPDLVVELPSKSRNRNCGNMPAC